MRTPLFPLLLALGGLVACGTGGSEPSSSGAPEDSHDTGGALPVSNTAVLLGDADRLLRISMTLRGTRPSPAEYAALAADPNALAGLVDVWLDDPHFGDTIRDIENQTLLVRRERFGRDVPEGVDVSSLGWALAGAEEPLRLIQYVVENDLPYTEIVTMDGTVGSALHARLWSGVDDSFDPAGPAWQPTSHTDGRPAAGVLSTGGWHKRWASNPANAKRLAAGAAARSLICVDYFAGDVELGTVDLSDEDAIDQALLEEPACVACHQTMDPLAGTLQGFGGRVQLNQGAPTQAWFPEDADDGFPRTGRENGYFGLGGADLTEVGQLIAADSRFSRCAAQRYVSWMTQTPLAEVDEAWVREAQAALVDGDMRIKAMVRTVVLSDAFAVSHDTDPALAESTRGLLRARPGQLDRMFRDLTGFTWAAGLGEDGHEFVVPTSASIGFQVHGGGIDSDTKTVPSHLYSAPASLFLRSFAAEAAGHVVESDFALAPEDRKLLQLVEPGTTDEVQLRAQLAWLHGRILGESVSADGTEVDATLALLAALRAETSSDEVAWKLLLLAMFQDIRVAFY